MERSKGLASEHGEGKVTLRNDEEGRARSEGGRGAGGMPDRGELGGREGIGARSWTTRNAHPPHLPTHLQPSFRASASGPRTATLLPRARTTPLDARLVRSPPLQPTLSRSPPSPPPTRCDPHLPSCPRRPGSLSRPSTETRTTTRVSTYRYITLSAEHAAQGQRSEADKKDVELTTLLPSSYARLSSTRR